MSKIRTDQIGTTDDSVTLDVGDIASEALLASTQAGEGASLVGTESGKTVETVLSDRAAAAESITDLRALEADFDGQLAVVSRTEGYFCVKWDAVSTDADDGVDVFAVSGVSTGRWVRQLEFYDNSSSGLSATNEPSAIDELDGRVGTIESGFTTKAIGETFNLSTHLTGITEPDNSSTAKFIKLTAGEDGVGGYNEGLLINETVTGSGPTIEITAEIATGPLAGNVINLLNSENRYLMPGENSGAVANDQMQQITGEFNTNALVDQQEGAFADSITGGSRADGSHASGKGYVDFNSANSPDARTGDHTNVKHVQVTYYMRVA